MTREEKVRFIVDAIDNIEGVRVDGSEFSNLPDDKLDKEVEWYDYLLGK